MRTLATMLVGSLLLAGAPAQASPDRDPEAKLARVLEGRVAGEPVNCISLSRVRSSQIIDDTAIVYDAGRIVYVNRPRAGAESLDQWDTLVTRLYSSQLCRIDTVQLYDSSTWMQTGFVFLGDFVPYEKVDTAE